MKLKIKKNSYLWEKNIKT